MCSTRFEAQQDILTTLRCFVSVYILIVFFVDLAQADLWSIQELLER